MPKITFIQLDNSKKTVKTKSGLSLKDVAVEHDISGVGAACGGSCACATCHIYVDTEWASKIEQASEEEMDLLDTTANVQDNSRLSCQVVTTDAMDGLKIHIVPASA